MKPLPPLARMREFDFSALELERAQDWPVIAKGICALCLLLVSLLLGDWLCLHELRAQLRQARSQESSLREQFSTKAFQAAGLERQREQVFELQAALADLLRQWPGEDEMTGLLEDMDRAGQAHGVLFEDIRLLPETVHAFHIEQPIRMGLVGTYHGLAAFLGELSRLPRMVTLHDFEVAADASSAAGLRMGIQARTYRYRDKEGNR
ncbi:type 4a pilus biogenesis protein PilO [Stutzerimonas kirkiae]|uniref:Pilus assembly protein PilP n=1 Tax=Stutzerimonas kirkiae TaxID=2211392 RepID=A0A4Q9R0I4_9GAMM|nr:type 4a pilus biogenesis protein PilO [Stutzerimonas kirkiae]TBU92161.1 pilus assembly protein PilP [Stutzerimonas kirkiae]TBU99531.1 pilus assembly protein PilP [Stutzerimonas kirkiae]TBV10444.1 pilus assembly protein PilP [Stutzerimonas kirkiae]TBV14000.1 pilus assembly protein PilP [Stutzerimonas kirkiae]